MKVKELIENNEHNYKIRKNTCILGVKNMISENKLKHSLGVARACVEEGKRLGLPEDDLDACFVMGLLHDIGYEKEGKITEHPKRGYKMICNAINHMPEIIDAIYYHGRCDKDKMSVYDYILNYADMTVDHEGKTVSIDQRLTSIAERYSNSTDKHYAHAKKQAAAVQQYKKNLKSTH